MIRPLISRLWRNRCHWSLAVLALPAVLLPDAVKPLPVFPQPEGSAVQAGPWIARLWPLDGSPPHPAEGPFAEKEFVLHWCDGCARTIRQARLLVAPAPPDVATVRTDGTMLHGAENTPAAAVPFPPLPPETPARLWLWVEGWDGHSHLTSLPLTASGQLPSIAGPSKTGPP